jgi:hypothetical protein
MESNDFKELDEEVKFVPTKEELLVTVGQPDKKRKRDEALGVSGGKDDDAGKRPAKRLQKEDQQAGPDEEVDIAQS